MIGFLKQLALVLNGIYVTEKSFNSRNFQKLLTKCIGQPLGLTNHQQLHNTLYIYSIMFHICLESVACESISSCDSLEFKRGL